MSEQPAPIIIKRKKVIAGGHHGGAWKVAYADFVTAMMAFFLLMWLLGATTEKQRKGIADYFNPTVPVNKVSGGGDGAFGGDSIYSEETLAKNGTGAGLTVRADPSTAKGENGTNPESEDQTAAPDGQKTLAEIEKELTGNAGESMVSDLVKRHIITKLTDEGLIVEIFETRDTKLFDQDGEPTAVMRDLTRSLAQVFRLASNDIAIQGHMAAVPLAARRNPVWENSTARADVVRRLLQGNAIAPARIQRVAGFADRKPAAHDPLSVRNNRVEIILLRHKL